MDQIARLGALDESGVELRQGLRRCAGRVALAELLSVERMGLKYGLRLHRREDRSVVVVMRRARRRVVEAEFRRVGVQIVDEYGCRIDRSQFDKEADPRFNKKMGPGLWGFLGLAFGPKWLAARLNEKYLRQSSDNAGSE